jgi:hypothetical protein
VKTGVKARFQPTPKCRARSSGNGSEGS